MPGNESRIIKLVGWSKVGASFGPAFSVSFGRDAMALTTNLCGLLGRAFSRVHNLKPGVIGICFTFAADKTLAVARRRISVQCNVLGCGPVTGLTADAKFRHHGVGMLRSTRGSWLPVGRVTANTDVIPRQYTFWLISDLRGHHEDIIPPDPALVVEQIDKGEIVQQVALAALYPVGLVMMRTGRLNHACGGSAGLRYPEFLTPPGELELAAEILQRHIIEIADHGRGTGNLRHGPMIRAMPGRVGPRMARTTGVGRNVASFTRRSRGLTHQLF